MERVMAGMVLSKVVGEEGIGSYLVFGSEPIVLAERIDLLRTWRFLRAGPR